MYLMFFILWVIFNGAFTLEIAAIGVVVAGAVFWFTCSFLDHSIQKEVQMFREAGLVFRYLAQLIWEIVKANLSVIRMILTEQEEIQPAIVRFSTRLQTPRCKTMLANAITLTPGTITVTLENQEYMVHCLDESMAEGIDQSVFTEILEKMEGGEKK